MAGEIFAGIGALKSAFDLAKGIKEIDDAAKRNSAVIDLQSTILTAQQAQGELLNENSELKKENTALKAWGVEKSRYELIDLYRGLFAYVLKAGCEQGEPPHALCANCFQQGKKSILQSSGDIQTHNRTWDCPSCKTKIKNSYADMAALIKKSREMKGQSHV